MRWSWALLASSPSGEGCLLGPSSTMDAHMSLLGVARCLTAGEMKQSRSSLSLFSLTACKAARSETR